MPAANPSSTNPLIEQILEALITVAGPHPGFRPVHAKGGMVSGVFTPSPDAWKLTRAPHATRPSTPVLVRFSDSAGLPTIADNDPKGASPRGFAIRFYLGEHIHTDIVAHSHNGFPVRTGEEFLAFLQAAMGSGPEATKPTPIESFLSKHPTAKAFVEAPKPIPTSFAREMFFAINAFRFTNPEGQSRFGRFRIRPEAGMEYLSAEDAAKQSANFLFDELSQRLAKGPIKFKVSVQVAGDGDDVNNASIAWPDSRPEMPFGVVTLTQRVDDSDPEKRKIIFDPVPRVDGIDPSDDPLIEIRSDLYLLSGRKRRAASGK